MFASIKKKIAAETGKDIADLVPQLTERFSSRHGSVTSLTSLRTDEGAYNSVRNEDENVDTYWKSEMKKKQKLFDAEKSILYSEINSLKVTVSHLEGQNQKLLAHQESQEQIDNLKKQELSKIKHLLLIKDQEFEALKVQMSEQQQKSAILTEENSRLQQVQDVLDNLKHSTNRDLKVLNTEINRLTDEKKHLIDHVAILNNRQGQSERQNELERRLEEARFELTEIKTGWCEKISSLETQVERLSKHLADEHSEKVRLSKDVDQLVEQLKQTRNEIESYQLELKNKNLKLDRLNSEIVEMAQEMQYLQDDCTTVVEPFQNKSTKEEHFKDLTGAKSSDDSTDQNLTRVLKLHAFENTNNNPPLGERKMKFKECLQNLKTLQNDLRKIGEDFKMDLNVVENDFKSQLITLKDDTETTINALYELLRDKDMTIKLLHQQVNNVKDDSNQINQSIPDDSDDDNDINFQYLRHVVLKFITSPDQETKHLIRALSAALKLSPDEQQLLQQSIDAKNSWFPSRTSFKFTPI